jgi:hypothetical protein
VEGGVAYSANQQEWRVSFDRTLLNAVKSGTSQLDKGPPFAGSRERGITPAAAAHNNLFEMGLSFRPSYSLSPLWPFVPSSHHSLFNTRSPSPFAFCISQLLYVPFCLHVYSSVLALVWGTNIQYQQLFRLAQTPVSHQS